jgi:Sodium:sulfate symporter transmembrane region
VFASQVGHVGALYSSFLAMNLASGVPQTLAVLSLAYTTNLFGPQSHYSSGQSAVYFGGICFLTALLTYAVQSTFNSGFG